MTLPAIWITKHKIKGGIKSKNGQFFFFLVHSYYID